MGWAPRDLCVSLVCLKKKKRAYDAEKREALEACYFSSARAKNARDGLGERVGPFPLRPGPALGAAVAEAALLRSQLSRAALSSTWSAAKHKQAVTAAQVAGPLGVK